MSKRAVQKAQQRPTPSAGTRLQRGPVNQPSSTIMNVTINPTTSLELAKFLASHEDDIANDINDFGDLRSLFKDLFGFEPRKDALQSKDE